jgi:predicted AlkP superfamily phosphohydrolase/phosphomutase
MDNNVSIVIMSDHGFGPGSNKVFYPNKWLGQEGFLHLKDEESHRRALTKISRRCKKLAYSMLRDTKNAMVKNLPREMKETLMRHLPRARGKLQSYLFFSSIDWTRTKAFSDEMWDAIWINVKGREPEGIVEQGKEYEQCRDEIIEKLCRLRENDTGEYVVDKVYKREELYHGPLTYKLPDLTFTLKDFKYRIRPSGASVEDSRQGVLGEVDIEDRPSGSHRPKGIFILRGNEFKHHTELANVHIMDLAPTILHAMGLPIPTDIDGRVITRAFEGECSPEYRESAESAVQQDDVSPYTDEESEEISKNLKQLGYME